MNTLNYNDKTITFVSTAHVSKDSVDEVKHVIETLQPDTVCVELDYGRAQGLTNPKASKPLDIREVIKSKKFGLFITNLILSSYQKQIADDLGSEVGGEMKQAILSGKEINASIQYIDRNVQTTFKRLWNSMGLWKKTQVATALIMSLFASDDEIDAQEIENLKSSDLLYKSIEELDDKYPEISQVILHERNYFMAEKIKKLSGTNIVVVLGAAHTDGVIKALNESHDLTKLNHVPEEKKNNWMQWILPVFFVVMLVLLTLDNPEVGFQQLLLWIGISSGLAVIGALISRAHPLTILVTACTTWLSILSPVLAVGMFAGLTEAYMRPPLETEFNTMTTDAKSLKGWYGNRILRIALVFILTSIFASIGTFVSGANIISQFFR
ncbi:pheromone shutdown protein [Erysipelothrix larvae]|uniref:Pheromone shutdown protein n=1 Tax=Erysipelothrix larvae TaxID=1514105 RepID=A0A0X8GY44_9FIRM|nr:TraB/GumN family protein [Erysipelothrix larvae]AMC92575.1 pheromone shutdown protein [Erysipelothrix larvae]